MITVNAAWWEMALAKSELRVANVLNRGKPQAMAKLNRARAAYNRSITGKPPAQRYEPDLETTIDGIPCGIVITYYSAPEINNWGHPDDRLPDEPAEVDFFVVDRQGYPAHWLEKKTDYSALREWVLNEMEKGDNDE